jgi:cytochrome c oxidase subunit IV
MSDTTPTSSEHAGHDSHGHHDDHHGISHVASLKVLLGTGGALMFLTVVTVLATKVDFGQSINLALAMAIAAIKATLVVLFFMHLIYDKVFHSVLLVGGILAAGLFVGFALMDSNQYQDTIRWDRNAPLASPMGPRPIVVK